MRHTLAEERRWHQPVSVQCEVPGESPIGCHRPFSQAREPGAAKAVEQRCAAVAYEADPGCCEKRIRRGTGMKALLARGLRVWDARSKGKVIERSASNKS